jgi:SET domain-containing protein
MIKLLYIPSGETIQWQSCQEEFIKTGNEFTVDYNKSHWKEAWGDTPDSLIPHFCNPENEEDTKKAHKIPIKTKLDPKEFELIYEDETAP